MLRKLRRRLTYANVVSTLCLFLVVAGGTAWAANTVFSTDIVDGEVKTPDLASGAVNSNRLAANSVTSPKVAADALGAVDLAPNSVGGSEIAPDSVTGTKVVESTLNGASINGVDAETLDGGSLCRTDGTVRLVATEGTPLDTRFVCSSGPMFLTLACTHNASTAVARVLLDTSADDVFVSSGVSDNPDLDALDPPAAVASATNTSGEPGTVFTGDTSFAAGLESGEALSGTATVEAIRHLSASSECHFVVGATD